MLLALFAVFVSCRSRRPERSYFNKKTYAKRLLDRLNRQRADSENGFEAVGLLSEKNQFLYQHLLDRPEMFGMTKRQANIMLRMAAQSNMRKMG